MKLLTFTLLLFVSSVAYPNDSVIVSKRDWFSDPAIVEIRKIYKQVSSLNQNDKLRRQSREFFDENNGGMSSVDRYIEIDGICRLLVNSWGTGDFKATTENYYDPDGNLVFAYFLYKNSNGFDWRWRFYFDGPTGRLIWHNRTLTNPVNFDDPPKFEEIEFAGLDIGDQDFYPGGSGLRIDDIVEYSCK